MRLSHRMHLTTSFRKLHPPQNRQLIVYSYELRVEGADVAAVAAKGAVTDAESVSEDVSENVNPIRPAATPLHHYVRASTAVEESRYMEDSQDKISVLIFW